MRKILLCTVAAFLSVSAARADVQEKAREVEKTSEATLVERMGDSPTNDDLAFLRFATLTKPGDITEPGDILQISRPFEYWNLRCDMRLSTNRRVCHVEQVALQDGATLVWRVATNHENRPVAVLSLPADVDTSKGVRMKFAGLEKVLDASLFRCTANACVGGFYFEGFVQAAIMKSPLVGFSFQRKDGNMIDAVLTMTGFGTALDAGGRDPFAKSLSGKPAKAETTKVKAPPQPKKKAKVAIEPRPVQAEKIATAIAAPKSTSTDRVAIDTVTPKKNVLY